MKKFGTPTGAGPGIESEKVGFEGAGTPLPVGPCALRLVFFALVTTVGFGLRLCLGFALCLADFFSGLDWPVGAGGAC